ncbi:uncharacterized protein [Haliotis cracherodii]|uniref:uncharacterized protein isoform X1 n=1 Tax=Haliotis cracherodii TaxID=6455 RepID=UPI0039E7D9DD
MRVLSLSCTLHPVQLVHIQIDALYVHRIGQQLGYTRKFLSPSSVRVQIPGGFPYEAFDGAARIRPWSVLHLIDSARVYFCIPTIDDTDRSFIDFHLLCQNNLPFIVSLKLEIAPALYDVSIPKAPIIVDTYLSNIGNSSLVLAHNVMHPDIAQPLAKCWIQNVFVSKTTRQPENIPQEYKETYGQLCEDGKPLIIKPLLKPANRDLISTVDMRVYGSDTDPNLHTNYINYLRYCLNGLAAIAHRELSANKPPHDLNHYVKSASMLYQKESLVGDELIVDVWKDGGNSHALNFEILKQDSRLFQSKIELHTDDICM